MWLIPLSATLGSARTARAFCGSYQYDASNSACEEHILFPRHSIWDFVIAMAMRSLS